MKITRRKMLVSAGGMLGASFLPALEAQEKPSASRNSRKSRAALTELFSLETSSAA